MAFETIIKNVEEILEDLKAYCNSSLRYYKLKALRKIVNACSVTFKVLLCMVLIILSLFFISIAVAALIGRLIDSYFFGFLIVGGFYFLLFLIAISFGVKIVRRPMLRMLVKKLFDTGSKKQ